MLGCCVCEDYSVYSGMETLLIGGVAAVIVSKYEDDNDDNYDYNIII